MARSRYRFLPDDPAPYFITVTTVNWLPLFGNMEIARIVLDSLRFLMAKQRLILHAYVIMENHLHLVAGSEDLSRVIGDFKSFTARKCIDYYKEQHIDFVLDQLASLKMKTKVDREYQFWQEGSHPQRIMDEAMLRQKIDYIHYNPVRRGYIDLAEQWRYSSARDYLGIPGVLPVCMEW